MTYLCSNSMQYTQYMSSVRLRMHICQQKIVWSLPACGIVHFNAAEIFPPFDERWCGREAIDYFQQQHHQHQQRYSVAASCYCRCDVDNSIYGAAHVASVAPPPRHFSHPYVRRHDRWQTVRKIHTDFIRSSHRYRLALLMLLLPPRSSMIDQI